MVGVGPPARPFSLPTPGPPPGGGRKVKSTKAGTIACVIGYRFPPLRPEFGWVPLHILPFLQNLILLFLLGTETLLPTFRMLLHILLRFLYHWVLHVL